jgi:hypothetical protein
MKVLGLLDLRIDHYLEELKRMTIKRLEMAYGYIHNLYGMCCSKGRLCEGTRFEGLL